MDGSSSILNPRVSMRKGKNKFKSAASFKECYTQFILIRNGLIRNASGINGIFKKQLAALSNLRNRNSISIFLKNALMERFQNKKHIVR